jgi:predicted metal-dependent hydrolase
VTFSPAPDSGPVSTPEGLSERLIPGARLFAAGEWWEAHEAWEGHWMTATGDERHFVQGLILLAAALHKRWHHGSLTHRNYHKATAHLDRLPTWPGGSYGGVDLVRLRREVWEALEQEGMYPALQAPA